MIVQNLDRPTKDQPRLPGDLIIWVFIVGELTTFAVLFLVYAFARARNVALFNESQLTLDLTSGAINTVLLITGSWLVVKAVHAVKDDQARKGAYWLMSGMACGFAFLGVKWLEYGDKSAAGLDISTNTFYTFYFSLTFFHFMHVIVGLVFLGVVLPKTWRREYGKNNHNTLESSAAYWHMVDLLWIVLFPLIYVMR
ncbi:MAG: hypothetical protein RIR18_901 [Pseudomonadota bacterium]